jgi:beta-xylosidase
LYTSHRAGGANIPVQTGTSLTGFGPPRDALPTLPKWSVPGYTWAPDVHRFGDHYVLYFTSAFIGSEPSIECIGAAVGSAPEGPFTPLQVPFVCQAAHRGSIDPRTFSDLDGTTYLLWKSDDNADVHGAERTGIYIQRLGGTGLTLFGSPTLLFAPDEPWQGRIVEAPDLVVANGVYWLFYSGGWFNQPTYAIGAARCATALGPCADVSATPLLSSNAQGLGPGEESLFTDASGVYLLYTPAHSNTPEVTPPRQVAVARIGFASTGVYLGFFKAG